MALPSEVLDEVATAGTGSPIRPVQLKELPRDSAGAVDVNGRAGMTANFDQRTAAAFHEAGHAVAAVMSGFIIEQVDLNAKDGRLGRCSFARTGNHLELAESEAFVAVSGGAAQLLYSQTVTVDGEQIFTGCEGDFQKIASVLSQANKASDDMALSLRMCLACKVLMNPSIWRHVEAVAGALLQRKVLTCDEVNGLTQGVPRYEQASINLIWQMMPLRHLLHDWADA